MKYFRFAYLLIVLLTINIVNCQTPYIGEIRMFAGNFAPKGWAFCNGQLLSISEYDDLFSIIGTLYGGDGRENFALPDLRGKGPIHVEHEMSPTNITLGTTGGTSSFSLTEAQMPKHRHTGHLRIHDGYGDAYHSQHGYLVDSTMVSHEKYSSFNIIGEKVIRGVQTDAAGEGLPVQKRSPYLVINFIIALEGAFPSRN